VLSEGFGPRIGGTLDLIQPGVHLQNIPDVFQRPNQGARSSRMSTPPRSKSLRS